MCRSAVALVCGLPGSGKTFLVESVFRRLDDKRSAKKSLVEVSTDFLPYINLFWINFDQLVPLSVQKELINESGAWKRCRKDIFCAVECFFHYILGLKSSCTSLTDNVKNYLEKLIQMNRKSTMYNCNVFLIEDNFYYQSMRYEWYQLARKLQMGFCQIYLDCSKETALSQNLQRKEKVSDDAILLMAERIEIPNVNINKWEKNSIIINVENGLGNHHADEVLDVFDKALKNPETPAVVDNLTKVTSQKICSMNAVHQIDLILRRLISEKIQRERVSNMDRESLKTFSTCVARARPKIIEKLKLGEISMNKDILLAIEEGRGFDVIVELRNTLESILDSFVE
ncbi:L-seryl-tRNA(Sec) kinase isoform X2 [Centruroides vittatus]|uniref:L-seryl-tRNA(Sec) kinase isoform X2 n=1 Tax=Centruroides vittatus TaxID=120091 RepID=UPI00350FB168